MKKIFFIIHLFSITLIYSQKKHTYTAPPPPSNYYYFSEKKDLGFFESQNKWDVIKSESIDNFLEYTIMLSSSVLGFLETYSINQNQGSPYQNRTKKEVDSFFSDKEIGEKLILKRESEKFQKLLNLRELKGISTVENSKGLYYTIFLGKEEKGDVILCVIYNFNKLHIFQFFYTQSNIEISEVVNSISKFMTVLRIIN